jgi:hypothetical protein
MSEKRVKCNTNTQSTGIEEYLHTIFFKTVSYLIKKIQREHMQADLRIYKYTNVST